MAIYEFPVASGAAMPSTAEVAAELVRLDLPGAGMQAEPRGDTIRLSWAEGAQHFFDASGRRIAAPQRDAATMLS